MNGTGRRFPMTAATQAAHGDNPAAAPAGMAPRSSTTGTAAMAMVMTYFPNRVSQRGMVFSLRKNCPGV